MQAAVGRAQVGTTVFYKMTSFDMCDLLCTAATRAHLLPLVVAAAVGLAARMPASSCCRNAMSVEAASKGARFVAGLAFAGSACIIARGNH